MLFSIIFIKEVDKRKNLYRIFVIIMIRFNTINNKAIVIYIKNTKNSKRRESNSNPLYRRHCIYINKILKNKKNI